MFAAAAAMLASSSRSSFADSHIRQNQRISSAREGMNNVKVVSGEELDNCRANPPGGSNHGSACRSRDAIQIH